MTGQFIFRTVGGSPDHTVYVAVGIMEVPEDHMTDEKLLDVVFSNGTFIILPNAREPETEIRPVKFLAF